MKRLLSMALVLALCLGLAAPALAAEAPATVVEDADDIYELMGVDDADYGWDYDWDYGWDEPTLTLMVNGVASAAQITAENGVSYADAAALREVLGVEAVPAGLTGPLPIRATAEAAGWDVAWYGGGWWSRDQEVQLWDRVAYEVRLAQEFGPLNDFMAKAMARGMALIFSEEAYSGHETADVKLKRFSTLDGDKDYALTLAVDYTVQKGVMDMTLTFDLSQLLQFVAPSALAGLAAQGGLGVAQLTQLLQAGKAEMILDYNEGVMAWNVPLLALLDESMNGWMAMELGDLTGLGAMEEYSFVSTLYETMMIQASYAGAAYAAESFESSVSVLSIFAGRDRFSTQGGKTTYSFTTQAMNKAISALMAGGGEVYSIFKACELSYTLDDKGDVTMDMHIRPDMAGIADAETTQNGFTLFGSATFDRWLLPFLDMDITASGSGSQSRSASKLSVHWNNVGTLAMDSQATMDKTAKVPRQVKDVSPKTWTPQPAPDLGVIGGADGPTAILVAP